MDALDSVSIIILLGALLVLAGIMSSLVAMRFGAPLLLVFLVVGMLAGAGLAGSGCGLSLTSPSYHEADLTVVLENTKESSPSNLFHVTKEHDVYITGPQEFDPTFTPLLKPGETRTLKLGKQSVGATFKFAIWSSDSKQLKEVTCKWTAPFTISDPTVVGYHWDGVAIGGTSAVINDLFCVSW